MKKFTINDSMGTDDKSRKKRKRAIICLVIFIIIVLSLGLGILVHYLLKDKPQPTEEEVVEDLAALFPVKYTLELDPDMGSGIMYGNMELLMRCTNSSSKVVLNSIGIFVIKETVVISEISSNQILKFMITEEDQTITFQLVNSTFRAGFNYTISLDYDANINKQFQGVFQTGPNFVATVFQPNSAAEAFPCFDDPTMKAIFQLTIVRRADLISLSNTERSHSEDRNHSMVADVYKETPRMPTYLVAFVICDYKYVEQETNNGLKIRFYSPKPTEDLKAFASFTKKSLEFFTDYFDMNYTLPKLDVVPVNMYPLAGMENWGLILLSESFLPDVKDVNGRVLEVGISDTSGTSSIMPLEQLTKSLKLVLHEVIHQWIGNVVTPNNWKNNWLIEGLTEYLTLRYVYKLDDRFLKNKEDLDFIRLRAMFDVHLVPVNELAFTQAINIQGPLAFLILEEIVGEEKLKEGIRIFLKKYKLENAGEEEFWDCFEKFMERKDLSVKEIMKRWTSQENYPLVTVSGINSGQTVHVMQEAFSYVEEDHGKWIIPFTLSDSENRTGRHFYLQPETSTDISLNKPQWYIANNHGFYRVNYDTTNWQNLIHQLMQDHTAITPVQRTNLISDSWALVKSNKLDVNIFLSLLDYMNKETEYLPWMAFFGATSELFSYSSQSENLPTYLYFFQEKIKNIYQKVAWIDHGLSLNDRMLQNGVINEACRMEHPSCLSKANHLFKRWKTNPKENKIPTQFLRQVMCIGIRQGGTRDCLFVKDQLKTQPASIAIRMHFAISCSKKPWVLQSYSSVPCKNVIKAVNTATEIQHFDNINIGDAGSIFERKQMIIHQIKDSWSKYNLEKGVEGIKELSYKKKKTLSAKMRLPKDLIPLSYDIKVQPEIYGGDPTKFYFHGTVQMHIISLKPVRTITFHADNLEISNLTVYTNNEISSRVPILSTSIDKEKQMFNILLGTEIAANTSVTVKLNFRGNLKKQLSGLYLSSYYKRGKEIYLATTQFEPTSARKAFPCFDEPQMKAKFNVKIVRKKHYKSISNTNVKSTVKLEDDWIEDTYHTTPKMSTYLLAFIVCDFSYTSQMGSSNKTLVGVWVREDFMNETSFALERARTVLEFYAGYFQSPFPLEKLDLIGIPDFAAGAMENWGLITYRETALLNDPLMNSISQSERVTLVVAHELAHQWFGNLVTMCWWNDLWLNEGFATYISYFGIEHASKDPKTFDYFVIDTIHIALESDGSSASHPLNVPIRNRHDIMSAFDDISYNKGASILHMLRFFLGDEIFQKGLQRYISQHSYRNAQHNDLWMALTQEAEVQNQTIDISTTMSEWISEKNYPVVFVQWNNSELILSQEIFLYDDSLSSCSKTSRDVIWKVPFTYTTDQEKKFNKTSQDVIWLNSETRTLNVTEKWQSNRSWVMGNLKQFGFYRVNYDLSNWEALINQLKTNHTVIPAISRAQLINDAWSLAKAGMLSKEIPFKLLEYLENEKDDIPLSAIVTETDFLRNLLRKKPIFGLFQDFMRSKLRDTYYRLRYSDNKVYVTAFAAACEYGLPQCIDDAKQHFESWKKAFKNRQQNPIMVADIRTTCYCVGIHYGTKEDWNMVYQNYLHVIDVAEKKRLLYSLSCTTQLWLLEKFLLTAMKGEQIRSQDFNTVISGISSNPIGADIIWKYVKQDWEKIKKHFGGAFALGRIITSATKTFVEESQLQEVEKFMDENPELEDAKQSFDASIDKIRTKIKWLTKNYNLFKTWLEGQNLS
ncbi:thyrotropin-releasing hormone-degrading ectoenzyme-like isoform X2 [Octopus sinensis]|uniref:Thyrotropin-releasing hormone-degrading ectoenzyme-like isoform X2 n=1 Tax=Octopus sinensis TaxID=2607531 RepID=A0A6P7TFU5_9MOLL|nr:thyrotropin-releasing hormone-degrading ectoenzyme-like isoform X2 [Octopus sinensis]